MSVGEGEKQNMCSTDNILIPLVRGPGLIAEENRTGT